MRTNRQAFKLNAQDDHERSASFIEEESSSRQPRELGRQEVKAIPPKASTITRIKNVYGVPPYCYIYRFSSREEPEVEVKPQQVVDTKRIKKQPKQHSVARTRNKQDVVQRPKTPPESSSEAQAGRATEAEIVQMVENGTATISETRFSNGQLVYQVKINDSDGCIWLNARAFMELNPTLLLRHFQQQMQ